MNTVVDASVLGPMSTLSSGANGVIRRLEAFRLPGVPGDLVFKEYRPAGPAVSLGGLVKLVGVRQRMVAQRRAALDELAAWPLHVVTGTAGQAAGVLMRLIPDDYFEEMTLPSGARKRVAREVQHLIADPARARRHRVDVPADGDLTTRLRICERFAFALSLLHGAQIVYGDVSTRNVLYRLRPYPSVFLVDCDATRMSGSSAVNRQLHSPDWNPPETGGQSAATDRYKLGLFVLRCLLPGPGASLNRDWQTAAGVLDPGGLALLRLSLDGAPQGRPAARTWLFHLRGLLGYRPMPALPGTVPGPPGDGSRETGWRRGPDGWIPA
ncbi:hypothetical protein [Actinoplanes rectilineatus]|uniref:hypothetical protein n=1 Tax=Actinoplanes rectilineatus TaxID=113571 RepID=UPI0005F2920C|nr:hypothetical protein [Actinoplanes rectilineatus]